MSSHYISGACGFIGSHLAKRLLKEGHEVWGVDNLDCGFMENIADLMGNPNFHFRNADIRDDLCCDNIHDNIDYVWHLAAVGEVYRC